MNLGLLVPIHLVKLETLRDAGEPCPIAYAETTPGRSQQVGR
jgi:hypothetical protein